jgi:hypothetical protein
MGNSAHAVGASIIDAPLSAAMGAPLALAQGGTVLTTAFSADVGINMPI